jgi:hypothetical protein
MARDEDLTRRNFVRRCLFGATAASLAFARLTESRAADAPLLSPSDPAAKKLKYTEDASKVKEAGSNKCSSCVLYQGTDSSQQGPCQIFPGKQVKAAGWCTSWAPQL